MPPAARHGTTLSRRRRACTWRGAAALLALGLAVGPPAAAATTGSPPDTLAAARKPAPSALFRTDRVAHASLGLAAGVAAGSLSESPGWALATPVALGLVKEWRDRRAGGGIDAWDLAAGLAGGLLAAGIIAATTR